MIKDVSHVGLAVSDQDVALDFGVNKIGCEVRRDSTIDGCRQHDRWLSMD